MISKEKFWNVKIDFQFITIIITFFCYGLFGTISKNLNLFFSILTILIIFFFYFYYKFNNNFIIFKLYQLDIFFLFLFFTIFFVLNFNDLQTSLYGDEFADAIASTRTSTYSSIIFLNFIENDYLKNIPLKKVIYFFQFFQACFFILISFLFFKKRNLISLLAIIFFTIFFRFFLKEYGMHPPLQYFFTFLFTGFFGVNEFIVRLSYIVIYSFGCLIFFKQLCKQNNLYKSTLVAVFLFTIPIALLLSSSVNNSLWSFCFFTNFIIYLYFSKEINYKLLILVISIFALTREVIFVAIVPIIILILFDFIKNPKKNKKKIKEYFSYFVPILIFLPFLCKIFSLGSMVHGENFNFNEMISSLNFTFSNNTLLKSIMLNVPIYISIFIFFIFFPLKKEFFLKQFIILFFFTSLLIIFLSIDPALIGNPRYNLEYFLPFCFLGFLIFLNYFHSVKIAIFLKFFILFGLALNIFIIYLYPNKSFLNFYQNNDKKIYNDPFRVRYNYKEAYKYISQNNYQTKTYFIGVYYGVISEILYDYNHNQITSVQSFYKKQKQINNKQNLNFAEKINLNKKINSVLISNPDNKESKISMLLNDGWYLNKIFINKTYNTKIYHLLKKN